jgi:hypothetical protein
MSLLGQWESEQRQGGGSEGWSCEGFEEVTGCGVRVLEAQ